MYIRKDQSIVLATHLIITDIAEKWLSLLQHVVGIHSWTGNVKHHKCGHPDKGEVDEVEYLGQRVRGILCSEEVNLCASTSASSEPDDRVLPHRAA